MSLDCTAALFEDLAHGCNGFSYKYQGKYWFVVQGATAVYCSSNCWTNNEYIQYLLDFCDKSNVPVFVVLFLLSKWKKILVKYQISSEAYYFILGQKIRWKLHFFDSCVFDSLLNAHWWAKQSLESGYCIIIV